MIANVYKMYGSTDVFNSSKNFRTVYNNKMLMFPKKSFETHLEIIEVMMIMI
jgi:hypothetical protein